MNFSFSVTKKEMIIFVMISQLYFQVRFSLTLLLCFLVKLAKMDAS